MTTDPKALDALARTIEGHDGRMEDVCGLYWQGKRDARWVADSLLTLLDRDGYTLVPTATLDALREIAEEMRFWAIPALKVMALANPGAREAVRICDAALASLPAEQPAATPETEAGS